MEYLVGAVLALGIGVFAWLTGLDRDRAFYPVVLIVTASYFVLFAVLARAFPVLGWEMLALAFFTLLAVAGFKRSLWLVVFGLAAHGLFDLVRGDLIANPGVPRWWPMFCLTFDLVAAAWVAALVMRREPRAPRRGRRRIRG